MRHRPVGLGVQGLADAFIMLRMPFTSDEAKQLNQEILKQFTFCSNCFNGIGKEEGPYSTFKGSPISQGEFQYNMWEKLTRF